MKYNMQLNYSSNQSYVHSIPTIIKITFILVFLKLCNATYYNILHFLDVGIYLCLIKIALVAFLQCRCHRRPSDHLKRKRDRRRTLWVEAEGKKEGSRTGSRFIRSRLELLEQLCGIQRIRRLRPRWRKRFRSYCKVI